MKEAVLNRNKCLLVYIVGEIKVDF